MARVNLSDLVGTPDIDSEPAPVPAAEDRPTRARPQSSAAGEAEVGEGKPKYRHKVSFYQDREDTDRVRGAILHTMTTEGSRTLSQFIHKTVMAEVERLERKYNDGQPFPAVGARELPQGRPMGE
jgi:hypothetical protein